MNPLAPLSWQLVSLPSYWRPFLERLSSKCEEEEAVLSLRTLLFAIRDMPYVRPIGGKNGAQECIVQWRGTCSAKHFAAYELLDALALSPKLWLACYQLDFSKPYYSESLRILAENKRVYDVHNYLTCEIAGHTRVIDITFPAILGVHGLPVTGSWSGMEDFVLCCDPEETLCVKRIEDADREKRNWLSALNSDETQALRDQAICELMRIAMHGGA